MGKVNEEYARELIAERLKMQELTDLESSANLQ